jgi:hydroxypyruvate isomerase
VTEAPDLMLSLSLSSVLSATPKFSRPARAAELGYSRVESWWPWKTPTPVASEISDFVSSFERAGTSLLLLNLTEGSREFGGRGLAGIQAADREFWRNAESALAVARASGARFLNALAGDADGGSRERSFRLLTTRIARLADAAAALDVVILVEHLNPFDHPNYLLTSPEDTVAVVQKAADLASAGNVRMLADLYHLGRTGVALPEFLSQNAAIIGHVQVADAPGRGRPGTGTLPIRAAIASLRASAYAGSFGLEYLPTAGEHIPTAQQAMLLLVGETVSRG